MILLLYILPNTEILSKEKRKETMQFNTFIKGLSRLGKEPIKLSFKSKETYEGKKKLGTNTIRLYKYAKNKSLPTHNVPQDNKFSK
jgi:hypothetical protein